MISTKKMNDVEGQVEEDAISLASDHGRDYPNHDLSWFVVKEPKAQPVVEKKDLVSVSANPMKIRISDRIRDLLGESSQSYVRTLTDIIYDHMIFGKRYPPEYKEAACYVERRMGRIR